MVVSIVVRRFFLLVIVFVLIFVYSSKVLASTEINKCLDYLEAKDYKRAIEFGKRAVELYSKSFESFFCLGKAYFETGEFQLALSNFKEAERLAITKNQLMLAYGMIGRAKQALGDLDDALSYFQKSLNLARELGDTKSESSLVGDIASIFYDKGEFDKALEYFEISLKLAKDERDKGVIYNNIALVYINKGEYVKAIEYLIKSVEICKRYGDKHGFARTLVNLGQAFIFVKQFDLAETCLFDGLKILQEMNDKYWEAEAYGNLGVLYFLKGNISRAEVYLKKAYDIFKSIGVEKEAEVVLDALNKLSKLTELKRSN